MPVTDFVNATQAAAICGVTRQRWHQLMDEDDALPDPVTEIVTGSKVSKLWDRSAVHAYSLNRVRNAS